MQFQDDFDSDVLSQSLRLKPNVRMASQQGHGDLPVVAQMIADLTGPASRPRTQQSQSAGELPVVSPQGFELTLPVARPRTQQGNGELPAMQQQGLEQSSFPAGRPRTQQGV